ncbi:MAG: FGGY-family carbohydrate kinase [Planctomycetota bacterium]
MSDKRAAAYIAVDLGAESGRVMLGRVTSDRIELEEVHRFPEHHHHVDGFDRWNIEAIERDIRHGVQKALEREPAAKSVSVDTWGVDFVGLRDDGTVGADPIMYRAVPTAEVFARVTSDEQSARRVYDATGIQFLPFNTLFQWAAEQAGGRLSSKALLMADYFNWRLTGQPVASAKQEVSLASTTQAYDPRRRQWADALLEEHGIPPSLLPEIVPSGTDIGSLDGSTTRVVATCSHDTGNAVAATPLKPSSAYLSSGSWSLLGVELPEPTINETTRRFGFTNEVGFGHTIRLLKNISGLFLVQESRKDFEGEPSYADLAEMAEAAAPARSFIRPDAEPFATGGGMVEKIRRYCRETDQPEPESPGQVVRCCYESLALLYGVTLDGLAEVTGARPTSLNIVGGGSQARLLNQLATDATGVPVEAGPVEATALGNVGIQAITGGQLADLSELRRLVRASSNLQTFQPAGDLASHADRFNALPIS